jgi:hypothetical protein
MLSQAEYEEVLRMRSELAALRDDWEWTISNCFARKAGFNGDQPRWPQGTPGEPKPGGRWSGGAGTRTPFINNAPTGISTIDRTTDALGKTLAKVIDTLPKGRGPLYGIAVHTAFGVAVRFGNIKGIGPKDVETTWGGVDLRYGSLGSIRTDVILRNEVGDPIAIYDVKTGGARLTEARVKELRESVARGLRIPVIELHLQRGATLKSLYIATNHSIWVVAKLRDFRGVR